jgi:cobalt-zinc-cadmium resistance protein CzcA
MFFTALRIIMVLLAEHISKSVSYFIRAEGKVKSLDDIENIVVKNRNRHYLCKKNVADVRFGLNRLNCYHSNGEARRYLVK